MIMGDLVLLETEINQVMLKMIEGGLEITAVDNHLLRANPAPFYMHVGGHGDATKMATVIRNALAASKTPLATPAAAPRQPSNLIPHSLIRSSASKDRRTAASINSPCRAVIRSQKMACR
jgi:Domain of Unknown Function (DUF1259)